MADSVGALADDLRMRSDEDLVRLLSARPDLVQPVPPDLERLAFRATLPSAVGPVLMTLNRLELSVVEAVLTLPAPVGIDDVSAACGLDCSASLPRLRALALVWGPDDDLQANPGADDALAAPAGLGPPVLPLLSRLGPMILEQLATNLGLDPHVDTVAAALSDPAFLQQLLDDAGPAARRVAESLAGPMPYGDVPDALRRLGLDDADTPVRALLARGLLLPVSGTQVVLPREVATLLRGGRLFEGVGRPEVPAQPVPGLDSAAAGSVADAVRRVEKVLALWEQEPPSVLRSSGGGVGVRDLRRLVGELGVEESVVALLVEVAHQAGLLGSSNDGRWLPTAAYDAWMRDRPAGRWRTLAEAWLAMPRAGWPGESGGQMPRTLSRELFWPPIVGLRRAALDTLLELRKGTGAQPAAVTAAVSWRRPLHDSEDMTLAALAEATVLGLVAGGGLASYARELLDGRAEDAVATLDRLLPAPVDHVLLQADLTAVAPGPLEPDLARELELAADIESTGGATVYRFSEDSLRRAFDAGRSAADLHALLQARSRTPVPQALTYLVDDIARRHGAVRVGAVTSYIRCDDPATLDRVCSARESRALGLRRLAPTVVVATASATDVLKVLRRQGVAPAEEGARGELLVRAPEPRRAPPQPRQSYRDVGRAVPEKAVRAAVAALRAGERTHHRQRLRPSDPLTILTVLRDAAAAGQAVVIGYVNAQGVATQRTIWPQRVEGGYVTAYDSRHEEVRTFALHRITALGDETPD